MPMISDIQFAIGDIIIRKPTRSGEKPIYLVISTKQTWAGHFVVLQRLDQLVTINVRIEYPDSLIVEDAAHILRIANADG